MGEMAAVGVGGSLYSFTCGFVKRIILAFLSIEADTYRIPSKVSDT